ncbi:diguanylate cyclase [Undibacterium sp. RTI2.1]|uniref:GGDEF domain-containing response regulator n=1 Tax=unclassified Undibacterium TaxID=2630295 RepID=UPI002B2282F8|nr:MULTISPECIES: diguanylate cyclase [unclassified Undibacterium]MEB0033045.1 diguanylate cyclase [Undibacterium sp. RTI2.1]MEB0118893.1 diguanylate cyclase [Undibacterium sp. RTI2.2]
MKKQHILIVDDDEVDRKRVLRSLTQAAGSTHVVQASNAVAARRLISEQIFDCILLDYQLPGTNGFELLVELRESLGIKTPVVMLTGEGNEMVAVEAMKRGASDYLPKSLLAPDTLMRVIIQAVERTRLERELVEVRAQIEQQALYDSLTGLGNRRLFMRDLGRALASAQRTNLPLCLFMMDLDRFKGANDRHGHEAGDAILAEVGCRLSAIGRANDLFYRPGGDEFAALIDAVDIKTALLIANRIRHAISEPITWRDKQLSIGISIGIVPYSSGAEALDALIRNADVAMYQAKASGLGIASHMDLL